MNKADFYLQVETSLKAYCEEETSLKLQKQKLCDLLSANSEFSFVGFYDMETHPELGKCLHIAEYTSETVHPCPWIEIGNGVCGTAAKTEQIQIVPDVTKLDNYIACDDQTLSELVLPLNKSAETWFKGGDVWSVLDLDSPTKACFTQEDAEAINKLCVLLCSK